MVVDKTKPLLVLLAPILAAMMGSGGGVYVYMKNITPSQLQSMARPDPATGSELRLINQELNNIRKEVLRHLNNHPDIANQFDRRITRLETQLETVISNQNRILRRLER